jgi:AcrR family transcriptional regulator
MVPLMTVRLGMNEWVRAGLAELAAGGFAAVRVERLAKHLGVTKGSFYWHFADREALLTAMVAEWERIQTSEVIDRVDAVGGEPATRLARLSEAADAADARLEVAMRGWAVTEPSILAAVNRVDHRRLDYLQAIVESAGVPRQAAKARAHLLYYALIGEFSSGRGGSRAKRREMARLNQAMVLRWP